MATNPKYCEDDRALRRVTNWGMAANFGLFALKAAVGLTTGSMALVADGLHSISDMVTDIAVLLGAHFGAKEPDDEHPYGHRRIETFFAVFIAVFLAAAGGAMIYYAAGELARGEHSQPHVGVLAAALVSVVVKEIMYRATRKVAVRVHSASLFANAWHHRSDALSSVAVVLGYAAMRFGYGYGDQLAVIAVGVLIMLVAVRVLGDLVRELTENAADEETLAQIRAIIGSVQQIRRWHRLRTRNVGREIFLDVHILVDPALTIASAHEIATTLEERLDEEIARPVNVTVHVEPDLPDQGDGQL